MEGTLRENLASGKKHFQRVWTLSWMLVLVNPEPSIATNRELLISYLRTPNYADSRRERCYSYQRRKGEGFGSDRGPAAPLAGPGNDRALGRDPIRESIVGRPDLLRCGRVRADVARLSVCLSTCLSFSLRFLSPHGRESKGKPAWAGQDPRRLATGEMAMAIKGNL